MENCPFDTTGLTSDAIDLYADTCQAIRDTLSIHLTGNIDFTLEQFEVFRGCEALNLRGSFVIKQDNGNDSYVLFIESTRDAAGRRDMHRGTVYQKWGVGFL